jgi:hypothetical protein
VALERIIITRESKSNFDTFGCGQNFIGIIRHETPPAGGLLHNLIKILHSSAEHLAGVLFQQLDRSAAAAAAAAADLFHAQGAIPQEQEIERMNV